MSYRIFGILERTVQKGSREVIIGTTGVILKAAAGSLRATVYEYYFALRRVQL